MRNSKLFYLWMLTGLLFLATACSDDDDTSPEETTAGYALWVITDATDLSGLVTTSEDMFSGEVDPYAGSYTLLGAARNAGISYDGTIYNPSNIAGDLGLQKFSYEDGALAGDDDNFISNGSGRFFTFEVVSDTKGYYTDTNRNTKGIQTFNPSTMERTGEIDITDSIAKYMTDDVASTKIGSFMVENDGYLYTQIFYYNTSGLHAFDSTFLAVFDVETEALVNIDIHPDYIWLGFERKNINFVGQDDNGDLYLGSTCGNTTDRMQTRCLRIKDGETRFDDSWKLDCDDIIGEEGSYSLGGPAVYDGKLYIRMKATGMAADWSNLSDEDLYAYEIDIDTQSATKISSIPASSASSAYSVSGPVVIDDKVYFAVSNASYEGYYAYDPSTGTAEEAFSISGGIPSQLIEIK